MAKQRCSTADELFPDSTWAHSYRRFVREAMSIGALLKALAVEAYDAPESFGEGNSRGSFNSCLI